MEEYTKGNTGALKRTIEGIWEAEILRAFLHILVSLDEEYGYQSMSCWSVVRSAAKKLSIGDTLWRFIPSASALLLGKERANVIDTFVDSISHINTPEIRTAIRECMLTIPENAPYPTVAIEPIETP